MVDNSAENEIFVFMIFLGVIFSIIIVIAFYINVWIPFVNRRSYIKMEMSRTTGEKKKYWKKQLRYLYIEHIPVVGKLILIKILK